MWKNIPALIPKMDQESWKQSNFRQIHLFWYLTLDRSAVKSDSVFDGEVRLHFSGGCVNLLWLSVLFLVARVVCQWFDPQLLLLSLQQWFAGRVSVFLAGFVGIFNRNAQATRLFWWRVTLISSSSLMISIGPLQVPFLYSCRV